MEWQMRDEGCGIFPGAVSKPLSLREGFASRDSASRISGIRERQQLETRRALWCQNLGSKISPSLFKGKKKIGKSRDAPSFPLVIQAVFPRKMEIGLGGKKRAVERNPGLRLGVEKWDFGAFMGDENSHL